MQVSIITVCYNSSKTILETINSVNTQTYENIEHVFIDGCSKDDTLAIIKKTSTRNASIFSERDNGIYDAMNKGIQKCQGEIIFILNSDDILFDDQVVEKVVNQFNLNPNLEIAYGDIYISDENNIRLYTRNWKVSPYDPKKGFRSGWHPPHPGFIVRKNVYQKYGGFNTNFKIAADFELMFRLIEIEKLNSTILNFRVAVLREGGASNSIKGIFNGMKDIRQSFHIHGIKIPLCYFIKRYYFKLNQKFSFTSQT